jgi:hypothetical protein
MKIDFSGWWQTTDFRDKTLVFTTWANLIFWPLNLLPKVSEFTSAVGCRPMRWIESFKEESNRLSCELTNPWPWDASSTLTNPALKVVAPVGKQAKATLPTYVGKPVVTPVRQRLFS